jgi:trehalose 2-sulfotransferase
MVYDSKFRIQFAAVNGSLYEPYRRAKLPVSKTYCILITPRSGSTWLCRRIERLNVLSCPDEYFNVDEFATTLQYNPGRDIFEVFDIIAGKNCTNTGIFGFKMSYFDLEEFEREAKLTEVMLGEKYFFYLSRRNFVAQAISLYTAVESQIFHAFEKDPERQQRPEVPYDQNKIMYWACHILQQEYGIRRWLTANGVQPVLLSYEDLLVDVDAAVAKVAANLGVDLSGAPSIATPQTEKITADYAAAYERVFRDTHREFCLTWEARRGTLPCPYTAASLGSAVTAP